MKEIQWKPFDLLEFSFVSTPRVDPRGTGVLFVEHRPDPKNNGYTSSLVWTDWQGEERRNWTGGQHRDTEPQYSPDGRWLTFLSNRPIDGEKCGTQLWRMPIDGGEPEPLTRVAGGVNDYRWCPRSKHIAVVVRYHPDKEIEAAAEPQRDDSLESLYKQYTADVREIDSLLYKFDGSGFLEGKRRQVCVLTPGVGEPLALPRPITFGDFDHSEPAWSPDGRWLAVVACREDKADFQLFKDVWLFPVEGRAQPIKITQSLGSVALPEWSPDGRFIAYLGVERTHAGWYDHHSLWTAELNDLKGEVSLRNVTADWDVDFGMNAANDMGFPGSPPRLVFSPQGDRVYHITPERGSNQLVQVDLESGDCQLLTTGDRIIYHADLDPQQGKAVLAVGRAECPGEITVLDFSRPTGSLAAGSFTDEVLDPSRQRLSERSLYRPNETWLKEQGVALPQRFTFQASPESPEVDGWLLLPARASEEQPVPVILQIHGGPMSMYTSAFMMEFQLLVAQGYAVVFTNPRGSAGYGEAFRSAIEPGWGAVDYDDVMAGFNYALENFPVLDGNRAGVAGGSYGGYMTNWIIGHTDQFRAAVTMRCVANLHSFWGTCDLGPLWTDMYGGTPWEMPERYHQQSPLSYMHRAETPTLVIHSEEDHRCPVEQGEQVYSLLKYRGVDSEFVRYPGESHGLSRTGTPWHRIHRLERILDWFNRYLSER